MQVEIPVHYYFLPLNYFCFLILFQDKSFCYMYLVYDLMVFIYNPNELRLGSRKQYK